MTPPLTGRLPAARSRRRWRNVLVGTHPERLTLMVLFLVSTLVGVGMQVFPSIVSITSITVPLVMGGLFLGPRLLPWYVVYQLVLLTLALPKVPTFTPRPSSAVIVIFVIALIIMLTSFRRS